MRVTRQSDGEGTVNRGQDARQINAADVRYLAEHAQQLLNLLEAHKILALDTQGEDIVHGVGDGLENITAGRTQGGVEQLGILAAVGRKDVGVHVHTMLVHVDAAGHGVDVALGENLDERHLARQLTIDLALAQNRLQALALQPCVDGGIIIVQHVLDCLVLDNAGGGLGENTFGGTRSTRHVHGLVHRAHEQHLAIDCIQVVAHIHTVETLDLAKVTTLAQRQRLAGLVGVV